MMFSSLRLNYKFSMSVLSTDVNSHQGREGEVSSVSCAVGRNSHIWQFPV